MKLPSSVARNSLAEKIRDAHRNVSSASHYLDSRGISTDSAELFQLGVADGRLTIPYLTPAGPLLIKYRCLQKHNCKEHGHGKYMYDTGASLHLYNASVLLTAELVVVVEGEIDAISVTQLGVPAVAYPGAGQWKAHPHWRWCFDSLDDVIIVADADEPGRKAAANVAESLRQSVSADVRVIHLPGDDGTDTNSYIAQHGEHNYLQRLDLL